MARTANSRHDSYRNLSLAFESLLHELHPHVRKGPNRQSEGVWFRTALALADKCVPVGQFAPDGEPDPIEWISEHFYGEFRSALMHAKEDAESRAESGTSRRSFR